MQDDERRLGKAEALRRYRSKKRAFIDSLKAKPCFDCKGTFHPFVMDFDHRGGEAKRFNVSAAIPLGLSLETISEEVAKCDVICANCHRLRTLARTEASRMLTPAPKKPQPSERTHCPQGHPYNGENTRERSNRFGVKHRECIQCIRAADRERGRKKRATKAQ